MPRRNIHRPNVIFREVQKAGKTVARFGHRLRPGPTLMLVIALLILSACDNDRDGDSAAATQAAATQQAGDAGGAENGSAGSNADQSRTQPADDDQPDPDESGTAATPGAAAAQPATATPPSGTITLWHSWAGSKGDALSVLLSEWQTQFPDVQIETLFVSATDLPESYAEAVQNGGGPDLVLAQNWWLAEMVQAGVVAPVDHPDEPLLRSAAQDAYWPATLDSLRLDGRLYGLPLTFQSVALYVNTDLVDPATVPANTGAWLEQAAAAPENGIGLYANLFHVAWGFPAYGAQFMDDTGRVVLTQSGDAAGYLQWLVMIDRTQGSYVDLDYGMLLDRFKKGEFAYFVDGFWAAPDLRSVLGDALAVAPLPSGPAGAAGPWLYSEGLMLNPNLAPSQRDLAWRLAEFLGRPAAGVTLAQEGDLLPAAREVDAGDDPIRQGFLAQADTMAAMPVRPEMREAWGYGGDMLLKALTGTAPPPAIISETTTLINEANGK